LYACGITPYDATHIGHASTYIAWDLLGRAWRDAGLRVRYAQNVTDVDDPLLERAARDAVDWRELAEREIDRFRSDMSALRVLPPDYLIGAVEALRVIDEFSGVLADRGALYDVDDDVYFSRAADTRFGSVSGLDSVTMVALAAENGGDPGRPGKKDPLDPLVWRAERPGEPAWDSRFGRGRPGWHVECAAIATHYLGAEFDVQAGGRDLIFPHHEMSASHARVALAGRGTDVFARRYVHAGMVRLAGTKMSKSLGNLVFVSRLREAGTDPMAIRLAILAHHYRHDWDWTDDGLAEAAARLGRWRAAVAVAPGRPAGQVPAAAAVLTAIRDHLAADLDAPGAVSAVDAWADAVLAADAGMPRGRLDRAGRVGDGEPARVGDGDGGPAGRGDRDPARSASLVKDAVDALLGIAL
jgi:L-cysteine:1D-myo-inositol 2-amino-2-deoxy-alpha-D-glucopyranoside ligase